MVTAILGTSSCINDLDISPIDPQYAPSFDQNDVFVKEYALLGLTGQKGPAGSADLDGQDEGDAQTPAAQVVFPRPMPPDSSKLYEPDRRRCATKSRPAPAHQLPECKWPRRPYWAAVRLPPKLQ